MKVCPLVDGRHNNIDELWRCKALNVIIDDMATGEQFHPINNGADVAYSFIALTCCLERPEIPDGLLPMQNISCI
jgi:hypothetical protein